MERREQYTRSEQVSLVQRAFEYIIIGLFALVLGIYGLLHHPILFEVGIFVGAGIGVALILTIYYITPWFSLE